MSHEMEIVLIENLKNNGKLCPVSHFAFSKGCL
jgi:hypothetical protein